GLVAQHQILHSPSCASDGWARANRQIAGNAWSKKFNGQILEFPQIASGFQNLPYPCGPDVKKFSFPENFPAGFHEAGNWHDAKISTRPQQKCPANSTGHHGSLPNDYRLPATFTKPDKRSH